MSFASRNGRLVWQYSIGLLFGLALLSLAAPQARASEGLVLDEARRDALVALPPLLGDRLSKGALQDQVVVLAFFASWCPPCHPEFDHLKAVDETYRAQGVRVVAVNIFETYFGDDGGLRREEFLANKTPAFPVLGEGEQVADLFGSVERIPTVFVFARDGESTLHFIHEVGATKTHVGAQELVRAVEAALQQP